MFIIFYSMQAYRKVDGIENSTRKIISPIENELITKEQDLSKQDYDIVKHPLHLYRFYSNMRDSGISPNKYDGAIDDIYNIHNVSFSNNVAKFTRQTIINLGTMSQLGMSNETGWVILLWITFDDIKDDQWIISTYQCITTFNDNGFFVVYKNRQLHFRFNDEYISIYFYPIIHKWYHFTLQFVNNENYIYTIYIYMNGYLVREVSSKVNLDYNVLLNIGHKDAHGIGFNGSISDFRIYTHTLLDPLEILSVYDKGLPTFDIKYW